MDHDRRGNGYFWMYKYKIRGCAKRWWHRWYRCPYAHPRETARRRDPATHSGEICPFFARTNSCPDGNGCRFAHGIYEHHLHPDLFRTRRCTREFCTMKPCFYAHSEDQLRVVTRRRLSSQANPYYPLRNNPPASTSSDPLAVSNPLMNNPPIPQVPNDTDCSSSDSSTREPGRATVNLVLESLFQEE